MQTVVRDNGGKGGEGLMGDWQEMPFSQAVQVNPKVRLTRDEIYPFVDMAAVDTQSRRAYASEERRFKGGGSRFQNGDTLMARITPCLENGKTARYYASEVSRRQPAHGSTEFIVIRGRPDVTDNDFAYYLTRWNVVREYAIGQMSGTSGRQRVPVESLDHLIVPIPPLPKQRAIAHVLGILDEKIELNRRINESLEAMARALFKSWFVDFEPVCAKMEERDTRLPMHIAELFPDRLVDSELGKIPKGWEVKALGDCFDLTMGQSPPGSTYNENGEGLPFFQGNADFGHRYPKKRRYCTAPTRFASANKTLVSVRAPVGAINMAWEKCCIGRGIAALCHNSGSHSFTYYSALALQKKIQQYEHTGTVFGAITKSQFETITKVDPPAEFIDFFEDRVAPLDQQIRSNCLESRTLTILRDTLLPKLTSGDLKLAIVELDHV